MSTHRATGAPTTAPVDDAEMHDGPVDDAQQATAFRRDPSGSRAAALLLVAGILAISFNLRPAVASLGALLDEVSGRLALSPTVAGLLATLPVLCFAGLGPVAAPLARRFGIRVVLGATIGAAAVGLAVRALAHDTTLFVGGTIMALGGLAIGNVLLPACVKAYFPQRVGLLTAAYTTALAIGMTTSSALTVPIAEAGGSPAYGLGIWALTAAVAAVPWVFTLSLGGKGVPPRNGQEPPRLDLLRNPVAWALALFFGLQSGQAYAIFGWLPRSSRTRVWTPPRPGCCSRSSRSRPSRCRWRSRRSRAGCRTRGCWC